VAVCIPVSMTYGSPFCKSALLRVEAVLQVIACLAGDTLQGIACLAGDTLERVSAAGGLRIGARPRSCASLQLFRLLRRQHDGTI
jgi:hypothetical protein